MGRRYQKTPWNLNSIAAVIVIIGAVTLIFQPIAMFSPSKDEDDFYLAINIVLGGLLVLAGLVIIFIVAKGRYCGLLCRNHAETKNQPL